MHDPNTAYELLKARLDRGGMSVPVPLENYWRQRIDAAVQELTGKGIHLTDAADDSVLIADLAAESILSRDKPGHRPEWLRLAIRERWLRERQAGDAD